MKKRLPVPLTQLPLSLSLSLWPSLLPLPLLLSLLLPFSLGCGVVDDAADAQDADESVSATTMESALTTELSDQSSQSASATGAELAAAAVTRVDSHLTPRGCLTKEVHGATVTYTMNDCSGPYGLVHVTGTLTAVYSRASNGAVHVVISGSGIKINQWTIEVDATVDASQTGTVKRTMVACNSSGSGPRHMSVAREGDYTVTYDPVSECITLDGTWTTKAGLRTASTAVSDYARCKGHCPAAGGTITHTRVGGTAITLTYDGSATAAWSTSKGRSGTVNLTCVN